MKRAWSAAPHLCDGSESECQVGSSAREHFMDVPAEQQQVDECTSWMQDRGAGGTPNHRRAGLLISHYW